MGGKTAITAGLVTGILAGAAVLGGILFLAPSSPPPTASPPPAPPTAAPGSAVPSPSAAGSSPAAAPTAAAVSPAVSAEPSGGDTGFGVGEPAPVLVVPQVGGGEIDLAKLRGKPVWVNFMATWCPSCQDELPAMAGFAARYEDTGLEVILVDVREDEAAVAAFAEGLGVTFPVGLDGDGAAQDAWGAYALPVHYWIDAEGVVRDGALGGIGPDIMAAGLQTILPGVEVTPG
jgi:thiol-disulfide isomerase/thioredoxin